MKNPYATTDNQRIIASIGRKLMDISETMPMKGLKDEDIARTNRMSSFGDALTRFGTTFGPKSLNDVLKISGVSVKEAEEFMKIGYSK